MLIGFCRLGTALKRILKDWELHPKLKVVLQFPQIYFIPQPEVGFLSKMGSLGVASKARFCAGFCLIPPWCQTWSRMCILQGRFGSCIQSSGFMPPCLVFHGPTQVGARWPTGRASPFLMAYALSFPFPSCTHLGRSMKGGRGTH